MDIKNVVHKIVQFRTPKVVALFKLAAAVVAVVVAVDELIKIKKQNDEST